jgi:hypothetical protein
VRRTGKRTGKEVEEKMKSRGEIVSVGRMVFIVERVGLYLYE